MSMVNVTPNEIHNIELICRPTAETSFRKVPLFQVPVRNLLQLSPPVTYSNYFEAFLNLNRPITLLASLHHVRPPLQSLHPSM